VWLNQFIQTGYHPMDWGQGGAASAVSYVRQVGRKKMELLGEWDGVPIALNPDIVPESHRQFFQRQQLYFIDEFNNCFVHGGFDRQKEFKGQIEEVYYWDRELWLEALADNDSESHRGGKGKFRMITEFKHIFIGHTSTMKWKTDKPMKAANIYNLDTGAGRTGRLTIMDIESKKFWQSDPVRELYCR
jgi:serine/threonine protein phosphatase 1